MKFIPQIKSYKVWFRLVMLTWIAILADSFFLIVMHQIWSIFLFAALMACGFHLLGGEYQKKGWARG